MNDTEFFEQFITLLDAALASDDPKIKNALRKFMFIMALNLSDDDCEPGPFSKMMDTIDDLQRRLGSLEMKDNNNFTTTSPYGTQTWPYGVGIGTAASPPYIAPTTTGGSATSTGTTQWINIPTSTTATIATAGPANTIFGGTGCWSNTTGTYTINPEDEDSGTEIKNEINEKLAKLVSAD